MTPMQEQYEKIKSNYKDSILLYRLGDFYEAFDEDAVKLSKILGLTLTGRGKEDNRRPMAGLPYHALNNYLYKLIEAGEKVVIVDQNGEPVAGKLVERTVSKIITPGTILDEDILESGKNNYIGIFYKNKLFNFIYCDISTGEINAFYTSSEKEAINEVIKILPSELLLDKKLLEIKLQDFNGRIEHKDLDNTSPDKFLESFFNLKSISVLGLEDFPEIKTGLFNLLNHLQNTQKEKIKHIKKVNLYNYNNLMRLDTQTIRNLELIYNTNGNDKNTLYYCLNKAVTAMGKRMIRNWILQPLTIKEDIQERLNTVKVFFDNPILLDKLREFFRQIADVERISGKIGVMIANPRDLIALKSSIESIKNVKTEILNSKSENLKKYEILINEELLNLHEVIEHISNSIKEEPNPSLDEGGIIKEGFNKDVDYYRSLKSDAKQLLLEMQKREIEATGITSLKISFNNVFGYYIEITKSNVSKAPTHYIRKQTLANAERYITQELKELEDKILNADSELIKLERNLFIEIRNFAAQFISSYQKLGSLVAKLDALSNFALIARENNYILPKMEIDKWEIVNARHPVVEKLIDNFIPNDTSFNKPVHILTGPNMSGKSTYIRQVALITLMAQVGSFVPAESMNFTPVDRIFTRVGASDNLSKGESTFMVEMIETANILNNATKDSLIILDEVGRGTSTYDGVAIAWSVVEFILDKIKAKTLFATHYHELIDLEKFSPDIENYTVDVKEIANFESRISNENQETRNKELETSIKFLHKIKRGSASKSYGVYVAKIAGMPQEIVDKSQEILKKFENKPQKIESEGKKNNQMENDKLKIKNSPRSPRKIDTSQLGFVID